MYCRIRIWQRKNGLPTGQKLYAPGEVRTHVLRVTVVKNQNLIPVLNNIDVIFTNMPLNRSTF